MTFVEMYADALNEELGSSSTVLFTTALRKARINSGQKEFAKRTKCLTRQGSISIVDGTSEYDLEVSFTDFQELSKQGVRVRIVNGSTTTYIEGDDLEWTTVERLDTEQAGWRAWPASRPSFIYEQINGGARYLGLVPAPDITSPEVWTALVGYVAIPADMSADADVPLTVSANPLASLAPYHQALVHWAAYRLEKLRKNVQGSGMQFQLFEQYVAQYMASLATKGGQKVRLAFNYRGRSVPRQQRDPLRWP